MQKFEVQQLLLCSVFRKIQERAMAPKEAKKGQAAKKVAEPKKDNKKRKNDEQHGQRCNMLGQLKHAESALEALKKNRRKELWLTQPRLLI